MAPAYSTPENQKERFDRRAQNKSTADFMDEEYRAGVKAERRRARMVARQEAKNEPDVPRGTSRVGFTAPSSVPSIAAPMLVELIIISSDDFFNQHRAPLPSRLLAVFGIFGVLGLAKGNAARPAQAFAWALVLSSLYASAGPKGQGGALGALAKLGDFMSGKYGKTTTTKKAGP